MKQIYKKLLCFTVLLFLCAFVLTACGKETVQEEENVVIYAALNPVSEDLSRVVTAFNESLEEGSVQIEIRNYSDEGGIERLMTELAIGQVPDIMEMHYYGKNGRNIGVVGTGDKYYAVPGSYAAPADEYWMPYETMAQKGYLEDLWPYIEKQEEMGRDGVLQAPLKAAEVDGGLYIAFQDVILFTLSARQSVVGNRYSWTMDELMETLSNMPEGSTIMRHNTTRQEIYSNLLRYSLDQYVDRKTGDCYFSGEGFRDFIAFLESFPDSVGYETPEAVDEETINDIKLGRQLLEGAMLSWPRDIPMADAIWQETAAFPGYPTTDGSSGNFFYPNGTILAMSSTSKHKDIAWDFIYQQLFQPKLSKRDANLAGYNIPILLSDFEWNIWGDLEYANDDRNYDKNGLFYDKRQHFENGPPLTLEYPALTEEGVQRYRDLIDNTTQLYWPDDDLTDIVWEVLSAYFAGVQDLDQTVTLLDNRVGVYLNEQR